MLSTCISPASDLEAERERACKRYVRNQALKAAGVSALPVAGVDLFINGRLLARTLESINAAYGLTPQQIARLPAPTRDRLEDSVREVGSYLIGRVITRAAVFSAAKTLGLRIGAQQAAKLAPVAGLVASAALSGWLFKRLCERHVLHCRRVRAALPELPAPPPLARLGFDTPA